MPNTLCEICILDATGVVGVMGNVAVAPTLRLSKGLRQVGRASTRFAWGVLKLSKEVGMIWIRRGSWMVVLATITAVSLLVLAGCGSSTSAGLTPPSSSGNAEPSASSGGTPPVSNTVLTMSEKEFTISPATATAQTGKIDFTIKNDGTIVHNFAVDVAGKEYKSSDVQPGKSIPFSVTISVPGDYQFYCAIPGHRALGMNGTLTVTGNP
jgi:plastocyanin